MKGAKFNKNLFRLIKIIFLLFTILSIITCIVLTLVLCGGFSAAIIIAPNIYLKNYATLFDVIGILLLFFSCVFIVPAIIVIGVIFLFVGVGIMNKKNDKKEKEQKENLIKKDKTKNKDELNERLLDDHNDFIDMSETDSVQDYNNEKNNDFSVIN
jgi:predicted membrane protein